jgi:regulatory protein
LRYLAARPRSEAEIRRRLARAGCEADEAETVLARLRQAQLVDDSAFAEYWVDQRRTFRPRGARLVQAELRQHGIASPVAQSATADLSESAVQDALRALGRRAERELAVEPVDWTRVDARLSGFLARRGFDWSTIAAALRHLRAQHDDA